ncbi:hypothetical protein [Streptomyces sp. E-08]|uniref:hypothetical protein n=1 Tax=Streptomyces sp. E-08 TaxID=3404047 RepID=UPI003CF86EBC
MCLFRYDDDPEPEERHPAGPLYVPVRPGAPAVTVRLTRPPGVERPTADPTRPGLAPRPS